MKIAKSLNTKSSLKITALPSVTENFERCLYRLEEPYPCGKKRIFASYQWDAGGNVEEGRACVDEYRRSGRNKSRGTVINATDKQQQRNKLCDGQLY